VDVLVPCRRIALAREKEATQQEHRKAQLPTPSAEISISNFHLTPFRITLNHAFSYSFKGFIDMGLQYVLAN
jgi:hypothetical protein